MRSVLKLCIVLAAVSTIVARLCLKFVSLD
jgi:hypothetical protein